MLNWNFTIFLNPHNETDFKYSSMYLKWNKMKGSCQIHSTTLLQVIDENHKMKVTHKAINITDMQIIIMIFL